MRIRWRGLELPNRVVSDRTGLTDTFGKFTAEPFERGFGVTVGNSLRRILLSSLEGSAVTRLKIQGVQHEISTIPGVVEDVTDIILNVKSLVVKNSSEQPRTIRIDRHEKGVITAHFIFHWGVPKEIRPRKLPGIGELAILEFAPKGVRLTWRYATNGMSSYIQHHH